MNKKSSIEFNTKPLVLMSKEVNSNKVPYLVKPYAFNNKDNWDPKFFALLNDKSRLSNKKIYEVENLIWNKNINKHSSTSTVEWANSVYTYNKNYIKNLPIAGSVLNNLLTGYFNITRLINGKKSNSKAIIEKKNTLDKTLVSKSEVKITNDKVNLTVYIYNRNKETLLRRLSKTPDSFRGRSLLAKKKEMKKIIKKGINIIWKVF